MVSDGEDAYVYLAIRKNNSLGCTGVYREGKTGSWQAYITVRKKRYYLGSFTEYTEAVSVRKEAERQLHDPLIIEYYENLTADKKRIFLKYLCGDESNIGSGQIGIRK